MSKHEQARKKDQGIPGNGGEFSHHAHKDSPVALTKPADEEIRSALGHHLSPVIGWSRAEAARPSKKSERLRQLEERAVLAGQEIAATMSGDRAAWATRVILGRLSGIVKELHSQNTDPDGRYVQTQSLEDYEYQTEELVRTFTREANAEGPLPANGMPVLGRTEDGYVNRVNEDGDLIHQVRFVDRLPQDGDDGTAAIINYGYGSTRERHYTAGKAHDGSGDCPSERSEYTSGRVTLTRGHVKPHWGHLTPQDSPDGQPAEYITYERDAVDHGRLSDRKAGDVITRWMADGHRQDPAPGVPAITIHEAGGGRTEIYSPFGRVQDLADGTPSERSWTVDGKLTLEVRRYNDALWDSDDGEPAYRRWDTTGALIQELHYENYDLRGGHNPEAPRRAEKAYYAPSKPHQRYEG